MIRAVLTSFGLIVLAAAVPGRAGPILQGQDDHHDRQLSRRRTDRSRGPDRRAASAGAYSGNPTVVVKNVGGAGGLIGSNQLGEAAPNGESIGFFTLDVPGQLVGTSALKTHYSDFVLIAGVESPLVVYIRKDTPPGLNVATDLMKTQEFKALSLNAQNTNSLTRFWRSTCWGSNITPSRPTAA